MTLINLTERHWAANFPTPLEFVKHPFELDIYWASSLATIETNFQASPPRKKSMRDLWKPSAYLLIENIQIKRLWPDSFDEDDGVSLKQGLDKGKYSPHFELKDATGYRIAFWEAGNSKTYLKAREEFGFNRKQFVKVDKLYLQYLYYKPKRILIIVGLEKDNKPRTEEKGLLERLAERLRRPAILATS